MILFSIRFYYSDQATLMKELEDFVNSTITSHPPPSSFSPPQTISHINNSSSYKYIERVKTTHTNGLIHLKLNRLTIFTTHLPPSLSNDYTVTNKSSDVTATTIVIPVHLPTSGEPGDGRRRGWRLEEGRVDLVAGLLTSVMRTRDQCCVDTLESYPDVSIIIAILTVY